MARKDAPKQHEEEVVEAEFEVIEEGAEQQAEESAPLPSPHVTMSNGKRFYNSPPNYLEADDETRLLLDERMSRLDMRDLDTIFSYGQESIRGLDEVSQKIIDQAKANGLLMADMGKISEMVDGLDMSGIYEKLQNLGDGAVHQAKKNWREGLAGAGGFLLGGPVGAALAFAGVKGARMKMEHDKSKKNGGNSPEKIMDEIYQSSLNVRKIEAELKESQRSLKMARQASNSLGAARGMAYSEICLDTGAATEMLRRLDEEVLPDMQANPDKYDASDIEAFNLGRDTLDSVLLDLHGLQAVNQNAMIMLADMNRFFANAEAKLNSHLIRSLPQWRSQIAQGSNIVQAYQISERIQEADKFGGRMMTGIDKLHDTIEGMMKQSMEQGTFDPKSIIEANNNLAKRLQDLGSLQEHRLKLADARERLIESSSRLNQSFAESTHARLGYSGGEPGRLLAGPGEQAAKPDVKQIAAPATAEKTAFQEAADARLRGAADKAAGATTEGKGTTRRPANDSRKPK